MEGRVICAFSYRLLERQKEKGREREGKSGSELIKIASGREEGGTDEEDERWMVDTKLS